MVFGYSIDLHIQSIWTGPTSPDGLLFGYCIDLHNQFILTGLTTPVTRFFTKATALKLQSSGTELSEKQCNIYL